MHAGAVHACLWLCRQVSWCCCRVSFLPFSLWDAAHWVTIPASGVIAFLLLGIEEIGVQIEEPFGILPLGEACFLPLAPPVHNGTFLSALASEHIGAFLFALACKYPAPCLLHLGPLLQLLRVSQCAVPCTLHVFSLQVNVVVRECVHGWPKHGLRCAESICESAEKEIGQQAKDGSVRVYVQERVAQPAGGAASNGRVPTAGFMGSRGPSA
jgi:hypothetical protein